MKLGLALSLCSARGSSGPPAEYAGLTPLIDWNAANAVVSGSNVVSVPNSGSASCTLTGVSGHEPQYTSSQASLNGKPALYFPVGNQPRATFGDPGVTTNGPVSVVVVGYSTLDGANAYAISWANQQAAIYKNGSSDNWSGWLSANSTEIVSNNNADNPAVVLATLSGGTQKLYINSTTEEDSDASNGVVFSGGGAVGTYAALPTLDQFTFGGYIPRILIFGSLLDPTQRSTCMNALGTEYGITIT